MPRLLALLDDPSFGEPCVYSCNAELTKRRAGGCNQDEAYLCEAVGAAFFARFDKTEDAEKGGRGQDDDASTSDAEEEYAAGGKKKGSPSKGQTAFLKLSDHIKGVNLYELLEISEAASQDEIRKAYRALALKAHPDKQGDASEEQMKAVEEKFVQIQEGYEILSDPAKRPLYDSSLDFDESLPRFKPDSGEDFYEVFDEVFKRNARFSVRRPVPEIGGPSAEPKEWKKFYDFWYSFDSWRDPVVMAQANDEEICDLNDAECRDERRWMMKENDRIARRYKQAERERIMELVGMAEKYDPRIKAEKEAKKQARNAEAAQRAEAQQAVQRAKEEAERVKREEEEKKKAVEETKRKEEKAIREAAKSKVKVQRQRLRNFHPQVKSFVLMDQLNEVCLRFEEADLKALADKVEASLKSKKSKPEQAAKLLHEAIESIGLKAVTSVQEDDGQSTSASEEDAEVVRQRAIQAEKLRKQKEAEDKEKAAERAIRDAEKAEQKKVRDEQKRKENLAAEAAKRQQEKKQEQKSKKAEEKKKKDAEEAEQKREEQREEARQRAQEQAEADRAKNAEKNAEMEMERLVQLFSTDRMDRFPLLDAATDEELKGVLQQAIKDDPALKGALALAVLTQDREEAESETMLDRAMSLVYKLGPIWVLGLLLDPEVRLPNAIRNRAKKARQRLQNLVQVFLSQVSLDGADTKAATKEQRDIADGSEWAVVYNLQIKEAEEGAAKAAAAPAAQEEESPSAAKSSKKKKPAKNGEEDLDALLAAIEDPNVKAAKGKGGKNKKK